MSISKTEEICTCGSLERAAEAPEIIIEFNKKTGEFFLAYGPEGKSHLFMWHCFVCGGKAPKSLRESLFARLTDQERRRLISLTKHLKSVEEVVAALGEPDTDLDGGSSVTYPEQDGKPEKTIYYRTLSYQKLSDTARVEVTVYPQGQVAFSFSGKALEKMSGDK